MFIDDPGDTLFKFLWRLCDGRPEYDNGAELFRGLAMAIQDIGEFMVAVAYIKAEKSQNVQPS